MKTLGTSSFLAWCLITAGLGCATTAPSPDCIRTPQASPPEVSPSVVSAQPAPMDPQVQTEAIAAMLDDWHQAAGAADGPRYFGHFADEGIFMGTDATERWDVPAFRDYASPHFSKGKGWRFRSIRRSIMFAPDGKLAWFDEDLATEKMGPARGSGVVVWTESDGWKIAHYNLALTVPNERFDEVKTVLDGPPSPPTEPKPAP